MSAQLASKACDLTGLNTLGLTSHASKLLDISTTEELQWLSNHIAHTKEPIHILGGGSNVILEQNLEHLVVHPSMKGIRVLEETSDHVLLKAQAGESWSDLVRFCVERDGEAWRILQ